MKGQGGRLLVGTLLAAALLALFFRGIDWSALGQALRGARALPLVGLVLVTLAVYSMRAWRWGDLLAPLGRVGYADLFSATMVGFASGLLVPRAGELLRPFLVSRRYPISTSAGFATIILERLVDLITVLALFALYLFVLPAPAAQVEGRLTDLIKLGGAGAGVGALVVLFFLLALHSNAARVVGAVERLLARTPRWVAEPLGRILQSFSEGLAVLRAPFPHLAKIAAQSLAIWLLIALGFHLNHQAFGIDLPFHATFLLDRLPRRGRRDPDPRHGGRVPRLLPDRPPPGVRDRQDDGRRGGHRRPRAHEPPDPRLRPRSARPRGAEPRPAGRGDPGRTEALGGATLKCPFCSHLEDKVVDSRESKEGDVIRRRRECLDCGKRFTSYERIDQIPHLVVKKDGRRERFDREKVMQGLLKACEKRPVPVKALELVVERVEAMVQESPDREVPTDQIGEFLMDRLKELDKVAFVRFASVYRDFKDVDQFMATLKGLLEARD